MMEERFAALAGSVYEIQRKIGATAGALYILEHGRIVHESYNGRHDAAGTSRAVDAHTQFNVASIRKTYLALAVSLLIEQGRIGSIDDGVQQYVDDLPAGARGVTLRHLVTHTHGLREIDGRLVREFPAGEGWAYRNAGIAMLFRIVQRLTGLTLSAYMAKEVFEPYGLRETGWRTAPNEHLICNYYADPDNWVGPNDSAAGDQSNLFVSARELAAWGQIHLRHGWMDGLGQVLPRTVFERATTLHTPDTVPLLEPRNGYIWWLQHDTPLNQLGRSIPEGSYQVLGLTGCACLVIPAYEAVAVRMFNQLSNPDDYDYLDEIRTFGNNVCEALQK